MEHAASRAKVCLFWMLACGLGGVVLATLINDHGSILYVILGVQIGLIGAATEFVLLTRTTYRRRSALMRLMFLGSVVATLSVFPWIPSLFEHSHSEYFADYIRLMAWLILAAFIVSVLATVFVEDID